MDELERMAATSGSRCEGNEAVSHQESALLNYLCLLRRHKALILGGSLAPALLVVLVLYLWPRRYTATFVYERPLTESEYSVLLQRFYSRENLDKIIGRLQEKGLVGYAARLQAQPEQAFAKLVRFEVEPPYPKRLQTTDPATSERISAFQALLLFIQITADSQQEVSGVADVVTSNFESVLPVYEVRKTIKDSIQRFKTRAAEIEDSQFNRMLDLEREKASLEKLQGLGEDASNAPAGEVILQFTDVQSSREFLPLSYQLRAVQSKIIDLQETVATDARRYNYYLQVLDLNNRLLRKVEESLLTYYTVQQFLEFLGGELLSCEDEGVSDYLKSYIRTTENLILINTRAGERPMVCPVPKYVARSGVLTLIVCLMVAVFAAVLLEYRRIRYGPRP
jgi:hypothetical protein